MGKYMRKSSGDGGTGPTTPAVVVAGARTWSRSAAVASAPAPKRLRKARAEVAAVAEGRADERCCYLHLRSRRLFLVTAEVKSVPTAAVAEKEDDASPAVPLKAAGATTASVAVAAGVDSRCSSTASSADSTALRNDCSAKAREDCGEESSVSDSGCGRKLREATPSNRALPGDHSDQESSTAADDLSAHHRGRASAKVSCRARVRPSAEEIEAFFAAAEKAEADRFAAKYNFDVVRGVPLAGGRFEWTPAASG